MSVQLALLKSGEEVIADIKEYRDSEDNLVSYFFGEPHCIKINTQQVLLRQKMHHRSMRLSSISGWDSQRTKILL